MVNTGYKVNDMGIIVTWLCVILCGLWNETPVVRATYGLVPPQTRLENGVKKFKPTTMKPPESASIAHIPEWTSVPPCMFNCTKHVQCMFMMTSSSSGCSLYNSADGAEVVPGDSVGLAVFESTYTEG